jgi:hypothetical protein
MHVYEPAVVEGFEWVLPVQNEDFEVFRGLDGTPRHSTWSPIPMRLLTEDDSGRPLQRADFPWLGSHVLILRDRAVQAVGSVLEDYGELLPLDCAQADLSVLNVCRVVDALDEERSELVRFGTGRIMKIKRAAFREEALAEAHIFKLPQMLRGSIYLTENIVQQIRHAQLQGIDFRIVSDD